MCANLNLDITNQLGLFGRNFKCFREQSGFSTINSMNLIIGKNNSGKSTLLDMVQAAVDGGGGIGYLDLEPELTIKLNIDENFTNALLPKILGVSDENRGSFIKNFLLERSVEWSIGNYSNKIDSKKPFVENGLRIHGSGNASVVDDAYNAISRHFTNPFSGYKFARILADRDIVPENIEVGLSDELGTLTVTPNGTNATKAIGAFLQYQHLSSKLIEETLVGEFNRIANPDIRINRLVPRRKLDGTWEIHLDEPGKGLVPLSRAGSGAKTILLILIHLYVMPHIRKDLNLSHYLFLFEELENNLHPSLQRSVFLYLKNFASLHKCKFFVTTHSHVVIDLFARDDSAQIVHVTHDGDQAKATKISNRLGHGSIFDDLEVRASDLLQTNAIIWVEGPSDRIYLNKWIDLWSFGELKEHVDYEFVFTSGTLLEHYRFDDPIEEAKRIEALKINRHAILIMDSDRKTKDDPYKRWVDRIVKEFEAMGGIVWITKGKEIENCIPDDALRSFLGAQSLKTPGLQSDIFKIIKSHKKGDFRGRKTLLADRICLLLERDMIASHLDLGEKLTLICNSLRVWNHRTIIPGG